MVNPKFKKYPTIPHLAEVPRILDRPVEVYEKLDGGNAQVRLHQGRILAGNRSRFLTDRETRFSWFQDFLHWSQANYSFYNLPGNLIVFGEWLSPHTLDYFCEHRNRFYLIDLFDTENERFVPYKEAALILDELGIKDVQKLAQIFKGKTDRPHLESMVERSAYRPGKSEGLVVKNYETQQFAKLWESVIKRRTREVTQQDIRRAVLTMVESGKVVALESVIQEILDDMTRQKFTISEPSISRAVRSYFTNPTNLQ